MSTTEEATYDVNTGMYSSIPFKRTTETIGYFRMGCATAMGANYSLSNKLGLFAELNVNISSFESKNSKITKYFAEGEDYLPNMSIQDKETEYLKEYTYDNSSPDTNKPKKATSVITPASSIGAMVGFSVKF
jgi:hypothetical protein